MTHEDESALPYTSAQAFGAAITDRLKVLAAASGQLASQLRRQFAYDRLLARLFVTESQEWILKGGVSMIARLSARLRSVCTCDGSAPEMDSRTGSAPVASSSRS